MMFVEQLAATISPAGVRVLCNTLTLTHTQKNHHICLAYVNASVGVCITGTHMRS